MQKLRKMLEKKVEEDEEERKEKTQKTQKISENFVRKSNSWSRAQPRRKLSRPGVNVIKIFSIVTDDEAC